MDFRVKKESGFVHVGIEKGVGQWVLEEPNGTTGSSVEFPLGILGGIG